MTERGFKKEDYFVSMLRHARYSLQMRLEYILELIIFCSLFNLEKKKKKKKKN